MRPKDPELFGSCAAPDHPEHLDGVWEPLELYAAFPWRVHVVIGFQLEFTYLQSLHP